MAKKKDPTRVCEVPHMRIPSLKGPRKIYIEAFENEPQKNVEAEARRFNYNMKEVHRRAGADTSQTNHGIMLPN